MHKLQSTSELIVAHLFLQLWWSQHCLWHCFLLWWDGELF